MLPIGGIFEDKYEIVTQLGEGSFGQVYSARQLSTGQSVAIKTLRFWGGDSPEGVANQIARFRREMRLCAELSHPNIVSLIDSGESGEGVLYAVFEYVPGSTLRDLLAQDGRLEWQTARHVMAQVLDALACAHARGVVHRDLKPANIMVTKTGSRWSATVLDFGLGGLARDVVGWSLPRLTATYEALGTPSYAAPEQLRGEPPSTRSDLYAWGLIFLECLTGEPAVSGSSLQEIIHRQIGADPVPIPPLIRNRRLRHLLQRVTAKKVERRDITVEAVLQTLNLIDVEELPRPHEVIPRDSDIATTAFEGERRRLTVLFCKFVRNVSSEEYSRIAPDYEQAVTEVAARFGGLVSSFPGDGQLIYFGWPKASEDDVERAVRAALAIPRAIDSVNEERRPSVRLAVRVAVHTGMVTIGEDVRGEASDVAASIEAQAEPNTVVITAATQRLVAGLFVVENLGARQIEGFAEALGLFRVVRASGMRSRLELSEGRLTPFVGRQAELATLLASWERTQEGEGQAVLVNGEAGIGKSRLIFQLRECLSSVPHTWLECRGTPYTEGTPFYPMIQLLQQRLSFAPEEASAKKIEKLESTLTRMKVAVGEAVPLIAQFLNLPQPDGYSPLQMSPELQRRKTIELLATWLLGLADAQPLVLLLEDLHWHDPSSLELLGRVIEQSPTAQVLLVGTSRPEFAAPWPARSNLTALPLARLSKRQAREMVTSLAGDDLPAATVDKLVSRADGVPLYIEELTNAVMEPGAASVDSIPAALSDLLMSRLDRLATAKDVAQGAAVIGREFSYPLLAAVVEMSETTLRHELGILVESEIFFARGEPPQATYSFKHALVQEAAYESLLERTRAQLHARAAKVLAQMPAAAATPEILARHYAAGGLVTEAIDAYRRAGEQAAARPAYQEAQSYFAHALELLQTLPADAARDGTEIDLRLAYMAAVSALRGFGTPEFVASVERVETLLEAIGTGPQQVPGLLRLAVLHTNQLPRAHAYADALLRVAAPLGFPPLEMAGHMLRGTAAIVCRTIPEACADLKRALEIGDSVELPSPRTAFDVDPLAMGCSTYALALVLAGKPDSAAALVERGVRRASDLGHPRTQASALQIGATAFYMADEPRHVGELSEQCIALVADRGFHPIEVSARVLAGWARARQGDHAASDLMEAALHNAERHKVVAGMPHLYFAAAHAYLLQHDRQRALERVIRGEEFMQRSGEQVNYEPHPTLMRARILLDAGGPLDEVESLLRRALTFAEKIQSPWMLLLVAILLGQVALLTGERRQEARERLALLYGEFDEGFRTERLCEARGVLDQLTRF